MLGAERGEPGGVYFVTDGEPVVFREFISELIATQGVEAPKTQHAGTAGASDGRRERGHVANVPPEEHPADDAARLLAAVDGSDDRHLTRSRSARLPARQDDRRRHGRAARQARSSV